MYNSYTRVRAQSASSADFALTRRPRLAVARYIFKRPANGVCGRLALSWRQLLLPAGQFEEKTLAVCEKSWAIL